VLHLLSKQGGTGAARLCEDVLRNAQSGTILLHTSTWTIAETVKPKAKSLPGARALSAREITAIDSMSRWSWIKKIDVDQRIAFRSVELSRDFNLTPSDAIHAATAIIWKLDVLQKWDRDFSKVGHLITVEEPSIITPPNPQASMFESPPLGPHPDDFEPPKPN
jgi:predicted nucleic acid-binding protein